MKRAVAAVFLALTAAAVVLAVWSQTSGTKGAPPLSDSGRPVAIGWHPVEGWPSATLPAGAPVTGISPARVESSDLVLVNVWASNCGPCRREMPVLDWVDERPGVVVLGVSRDHREEDLTRFVAEHDVDFPNWQDQLAEYVEQFADRVPMALPYTLVIRDHRLLGFQLGAFESRSDVESALAALG